MREAVILAGGLGTRLRSEVPDLPKPMAPINGKPFLEVLLGSLRAKGFDRVVLSLGYMSERMVAHFGPAFGTMELDYAIETEPLGTGGALRLALSHCRSDHAFVFNGDTYLDLDVEAVDRQWRAHRVPIIVARQVDDTERYGRLMGRNGQVTSYAGSGISGPGLINAGCYVLPVQLLERPSLGNRFSFEQDFLLHVIGRESFDLFVSTGRFIDIGVPEDYRRAQLELADLPA